MSPTKKVRLISAIRQNIGGRWYLAGDMIELDESQAADLVAARFASFASKESEPERYNRRDMRAKQ